MSTLFSVAMVLGLLFLSWLCLMLATWWPRWSCYGPPYLYATFHHDEKGVREYTRDGCFLSRNILSGHRRERKIKEARDVQIGTYRGKEALYVVQAQSSHSSVLVYGGCDSVGNRQYLTTAASIDTTMGLNHPYGIAFDPNGNLYVSCQHTNTVLRFRKDTFEPMPLPDALRNVSLIDEATADIDVLPSIYEEVFQGTFYQFDIFPESSKKRKKRKRKKHSEPKQGVRDLVFVGENLWVACEDTKSVSIISPHGSEIHKFSPGKGLKPVGLLHDKGGSGLVFVSTRGKKKGPVLAIDPNSKEIVREYFVDGQLHSTGMVVYENTLYVATQELGSILSYDISSGRYLGVAASNFPDTIERLELSYC